MSNEDTAQVASAENAIRTHERAIFTTGQKAMLPTGDESGILLLSGAKGDLPPHRWDRFHRYESVGTFLTACEGGNNLVLPATVKIGVQTYKDKRYIEEYSSAGQVAALKRGPFIDPAWEGMTEPLSFEQVKAFMLGGWPEGAETIKTTMQAVEPPPAMDIRRKLVWTGEGDDLSTDRLYAGAFDSAWRTTKKRVSYAPQKIRIVVDLGSFCTACGTVGHNARYLNASSLFWRGAAAASLCDNLEAAGYQVEIVACAAIGCSTLAPCNMSTPTGGRDHPSFDVELDRLTGNAVRQDEAWGNEYNPDHNTAGIAVVVKDMDGPLNLSVVAAGTASALMYRRAMFLHHTAYAFPGEQVAHSKGIMIQVEQAPRTRQELGLDTEGVATLFVGQWVLTQRLANAWARGALYGIESVRTGYVPEGMPGSEVEA